MNDRIRELRKTLELSQKEFAQKIGLKQNAISYMEKAEPLSPSRMSKRSALSSASTNPGYVPAAEKCFLKMKKSNENFLISLISFPLHFKIT